MRVPYYNSGFRGNNGEDVSRQTAARDYDGQRHEHSVMARGRCVVLDVIAGKHVQHDADRYAVGGADRVYFLPSAVALLLLWDGTAVMSCFYGMVALGKGKLGVLIMPKTTWFAISPDPARALKNESGWKHKAKDDTCY